ncbi:hypothetical protein Tco_1349234, partial [Tanacetum coccineum]
MLKGVQSLTPAEKEAADFMQALKESTKTSKRQPGTGGLSEGIGTIPGVPNESIVVSTTSNEGSGTKPGVTDEEKVITEENVILEWGSEEESEYSKEDQLDDEEKDDKEDVETEYDEDEIYKYKICVRKYKDEEMTNAEVEESRNDDQKDIDADKAYAEKIEEAKDDSKKAKLPPTNAEISSLLDIKIQSEVPYIPSPSVLRVPVSVISKPTVLTPVQETSSAAPVTTLPLPFVPTTPHVPQQTTTPIPIPPITIETPNIITIVP